MTDTTRELSASAQTPELTGEAAAELAAHLGYRVQVRTLTLADVRIRSADPDGQRSDWAAHNAYIPAEEIPGFVVKTLAALVGDLPPTQLITTGQAFLIIDAVQNPPPSA